MAAIDTTAPVPGRASPASRDRGDFVSFFRHRRLGQHPARPLGKRTHQVGRPGRPVPTAPLPSSHPEHPCSSCQPRHGRRSPGGEGRRERRRLKLAPGTSLKVSCEGIPLGQLQKAPQPGFSFSLAKVRHPHPVLHPAQHRANSIITRSCREVQLVAGFPGRDQAVSAKLRAGD